MERLTKVGQVKPKNSLEVKTSKIGLGFEKLDRDVFDPEKAYDKVFEIGVKWARIQSGWQRTETEKGVYNFDWIESIIDNFLKRGITPWVCLCYGNSLYDDMAKKIFGATGCAPVRTEEQKIAWHNYVTAFVEKFKDRIEYYEVWNEPEHTWKHGQNATEYGEFVIATSKAVKAVYPEAKVIGGVICQRQLAFINEAFRTGMGDYIDFLSFHEYGAEETKEFEKVSALRGLINNYNPKIKLIQGESGSQSKSSGNGAVGLGAWTEKKQAKQLARHTISDLMCDVHFMSYFSCVDMIEALDGTVDDKASYMDYAYFGVLGADFDEDGKSCGSYSPKPSYYALQNIASIFAGEHELYDFPAIFRPDESYRYFGYDLRRNQIITGGFKKEHGEAFVYWYPTDIMTTGDFESTISMQIYSKYDKVRLVDVMDGSIYTLPEHTKPRAEYGYRNLPILDRDDFGMYHIYNLPIKDTPLILMFGDFIDE